MTTDIMPAHGDASLTNAFFDRGQAIRFARRVIAPAKEIRIATAFFELSGYALLQDELEGKAWKLLIGNEEAHHEKMRFFFDEFIASLAAFAPTEKIVLLRRFRAALKSGALAFRLGRPGKSGTFARRHEALRPAGIAHHAKLYIGDASACLVTSANFTQNGLMISREAGYVVEQPAEVTFYVEKFDQFFDEAEPLTEELLAIVDELLAFHSPYQVYARALLELYGLAETAEPGPLAPLADFQKPIVAGVLQTIHDFGGAMLVASTGLGKTVMAAHIAAVLRRENFILRVLIVAPAGLKDMWARTMRAANVSSREFSYQILSLDDWKRYRMVQNLDEELRHVDSKTLLILDESHHLRNAYETESEKDLRLRNHRIQKAVTAGARLLLMTATPYSRSVDDINNQLALLPAQAGKNLLGDTKTVWRIEQPAELSRVAVASVLTAPTVVSRFSRSDAEGNRYITFHESQKRYFPTSLKLHAVRFANPVNAALKTLLNSNLLRKRDEFSERDDLFSNLTDHERVSGRRDPLFESRLVHQFCSSVAEAIEVSKKLAKEGGYEKLRFARQAELSHLALGLLQEIKPLTEAEDKKYELLHEIVAAHPGEKILVFCIYRSTAAYLAERLLKDFPDHKAVTSVGKESDDLEQLLGHFAPVANGLVDLGQSDAFTEKLRGHEIHLLVATEAVSEGFNLQDAALLVNYDLPWTILSLAQRMGRILRPWHHPRIIEIWNFIPDTMELEDFRTARAWQSRLERRSSDYSSFADLPVLMKNEREEVQLYSVAAALGAQTEREVNLAETLTFIEAAEGIHTSTIFDDLAEIAPEVAAKILRLRPGFRSLLGARQTDDRFFLLIRIQQRQFCAVFDIAGKMLLPPENQMDILAAIRVPAADEPPDASHIDLAEYEAVERRCFEALATYLGRAREDCAILCSMLLRRG